MRCVRGILTAFAGRALLSLGLMAADLIPGVPAKENQRSLTPHDTERPVAPTGMVFVPGGRFDMGDSSGLGYPDERPVRRVRVGSFYMDRTEVSWEVWDEVHQWAVEHGYEFGEDYLFHPERERIHPVCFVSWYDAVKWANARSERSGRTPVCYLDREHSQVYRQGEIPLTADHIDAAAFGFRLPTEAEWEYAARGGLEHQHFPWPSSGATFTNLLNGSQANYWMSGDPFESESACATTPVAYFDGQQIPVGRDMSNGYGLYDMTGNVSEWCWDNYHDRTYAMSGLELDRPQGPASGYGRVLRGGSWISRPKYCRVSARYVSDAGYRCHCYGFRLVLTLPHEPGDRE